MDPKNQKAASAAARQKALLDISDEDLEKIKAHQASTKGAMPVDNEWLLATEFAITFGWQAYLDFKDDNISSEEFLTLIEASRKLRYREMYENAQTTFAGAGAAQSSKPSQTFSSMTKGIINKTKADES